MDCLFLGEMSECEQVLDDYLELKFSDSERVRQSVLAQVLTREAWQEEGELQLVEGVIVDKTLLLVRDSGVSEIAQIFDLDIITKAVAKYKVKGH